MNGQFAFQKNIYITWDLIDSGTKKKLLIFIYLD